MYLGWYDDNAKKPVAQKIAEAAQAYVARFGAPPTVVLCNERDVADVVGMTVRAETYIRINNFWLGMIEA